MQTTRCPFLIVSAILFLHLPAAAQAEPAESAPPISDADRADTEAGKKISGLIARDVAFEALQQFAAARGGTLGIAAAGPIEGLQAGIDAEVVEGNEGLFVQLGGLTVSPDVQVDAFGEAFQLDLPRFVESSTGVTQEFSTTTASSLGARLRVRRRDTLHVGELQTDSCLVAIAALRAAGRKADLNVTRSVMRHCDIEDLAGRSTHDVTLGVRALRRSAISEDGEASNGAAAEALYSWTRDAPNHTKSVSVGISWLRLYSAADELGDQDLTYPKLDMARAFASFEYRGSATVNEHDLLPRLGVYGAIGYGWWDERDGVERVHSNGHTQVEAGFYVGGRFQNKFQGMLAFRWLKSLGDDDAVFLVSVIPSASSDPEADAAAAKPAKP